MMWKMLPLGRQSTANIAIKNTYAHTRPLNPWTQNQKNPILTEIQDELAEIREVKTVKFVWTPGHAGISGNEKADERAKEALR
jgi:ribonuclease HI